MKKLNLTILLTLIFLSFFIQIEKVDAGALTTFFDFNFADYSTAELVGQNDWTGDEGAFWVDDADTYTFEKNLHCDWLTASYKTVMLEIEVDDTSSNDEITFYLKANGGSGQLILSSQSSIGWLAYAMIQEQSGTTWRFENSGGTPMFGAHTVQEGDWIEVIWTIDWGEKNSIWSAYNLTTSTDMGSYEFSAYSEYVIDIENFVLSNYDADVNIEGFAEVGGLEWDDDHLLDYVDEIKSIKMLWREPTATGWKFGIGIDIQNGLGTWDALNFEQDDYSIDEMITLKDLLGSTILKPNLIINSLDYVADWATGSYDATFTLYMGETPELAGQEITITLGDDDPPILTEEEWEEMVGFEYVITEYDYPIRGPLEQWLYSFTQKFPISWILDIKGLWDEEVEELDEAEATGDNLTVNWELPSDLTGSATPFNALIVPVINMTQVRSDYSTFFTLTRGILVYIFWITGAMIVISKTKGIINSLTTS